MLTCTNLERRVFVCGTCYKEFLSSNLWMKLAKFAIAYFKKSLPKQDASYTHVQWSTSSIRTRSLQMKCFVLSFPTFITEKDSKTKAKWVNSGEKPWLEMEFKFKIRILEMKFNLKSETLHKESTSDRKHPICYHAKLASCIIIAFTSQYF